VGALGRLVEREFAANPRRSGGIGPYARSVTWLDTTMMSWVDAHRFPLADQAARAVMAAATDRVVVSVVAIACLASVVVRRRYRLGAGVILAAVASTLVAGLLKEVVGRARPPASMALVHAGGLSMPSTDAALTSAVAVALYLGITRADPRHRKPVAGVLVVGVLAVGLCLVYLGAHWPTDVLAGWILGIAMGAGAAGVTIPRRRRPRAGIGSGLADSRV
jgi:membrane-associated phospholipid phosphatase